jgi:alpha-methylacyl-CoA racemase
MRPLAGVRVLDFSRLLPGPLCSWYLRGMGAEVIKLEAPVGGDPLRHMPPIGSDGMGVWFSALNAGVSSVALDLRAERGLEAARALVGAADVVIEGFRPGVMARLGLDPEQLLETWPRLIVASISGFGQSGSWRERPGHDLGYVGLTGLLAMNAGPSGVPSPLSTQIADIGGGSLTAALAIVGAMLERERTGRGAWLDISMTEGTLPFGLPWFAGANYEGSSPVASEHPLGGSLSQYRCYRCADDRVIAVAALEPKFLMDLCSRLGSEFPTDNRQWETLFMERPRDEWVARLEGCCVSPVLDFTELVDHPVHKERGSISSKGDRHAIRPPVGSAHAFIHAAVPALGEDTIRELSRVGIEWTDNQDDE